MKRFSIKKPLLALPLSLLLCAPLHAQPQPTLSLDFEEGVSGIGRDGKTVAARVEGKAEFAEGKFGKALKSGPGSGYLHFSTTGVLQPREGTVEMWVQPVDWDGTENKFHVFFDVRGQGAIYLYKFFSSGLLLLTAPDVDGPFRNALASPINGIETWKRGEWHHIAGTWSETQQHLYIDGKLAASASPSPPRRLNEEFMIGDNSWEGEVGGRTSSSLIDRVRIYDRALSPEHIAAHFAGDYNKVVPLTEKLMSLFHDLNPRTHLLSAVVDVGGADIEMGDKVFVEVLQNDQVVATQDAGFERSQSKVEFDLSKFKTGPYQLRAILRRAQNAAPVQVAKSFTLHEKPVLDTQWRGNKLGQGEKIPPPWTPLQVRRNGRNFSVLCWGREYQFGAAPLPTQITSLKQPLLAAPVALRVLSGGKELQWTNGQSEMKSASPYAVEITGRAQAQTATGLLVVNTAMRLEFDGVVVVNLSFVSPANFKADSIALEVPVREANAIYRHRWTAGWEGFSGNVPAGSGVVERQDFTPFTWLGDNDRGMFWFCETGQFWPNHKSANAYETVRSPGTIAMRFNLLAAGQSLPANCNYRFGLQATPIKPVPRDWRRSRISVDLQVPRATADVVWPTGKPDAHKWFGYPQAADPQAFDARVKATHARGIKVLPYSTLTQMWAETPEWLFFNRDWNLLRPSEKTTAEGVNYTPQFEWVTPANKDYSDWLVWKHHQFLQRYNLDGYYLDQVHPYPTTREEAGGWKDENGVWQSVYPILAYRDLYRRFYTMVKEDDPNNLVASHMSGKMGIPYVGFADAYLDGEHFRGKFKERGDTYMEHLPLDAFRAEYMGRQWGVAPYFLPALFHEDVTPEQRARVADRIEPSRELIALLMLHDVSPIVLWANPQPFFDAYDALDRFGYADSDFIPYFDAPPPATTNMKDVYTSVYKRSDGRALAIIANLSKENKNGTITLNAKRIGVSTPQVVSWPDQSAVQRAGDAITLEIPAQGYRMLLIGKAPGK